MFKLITRKYYSSSLSAKQMAVFQRITNWWHPNGPNQMLHLYNYERVKFLRKNLNDYPDYDPKYPLKNFKALDVGCGAGFLSQSLTRLGANVNALDPNITSYNEATNHKQNKKDLQNLRYHNITLQQYLENDPQNNEKFDLVTSMQVIEHVNNPHQFINTLSKCCKPEGLIMLSTIRRSLGTYLTHILGAQKITKIVPEGTHHHQKFINPQQCKKMMNDANISVIDLMEYRINWKGHFQQSDNGGNYLILGKKQSRLENQNNYNQNSNKIE